MGRSRPVRAILETGKWTDAHVEPPCHAAMYHYVVGARNVIELIFQRFREQGMSPHDADSLVFPLGLQCRHLVELRMKELYEVLSGEWPGKFHSLLNLWQGVRPMIEERWPNANRSSNDRFGHLPREVIEEFGIVLRQEGQLDRAEALIRALHEVDPHGQSFRYPGRIPSDIKSISLERLAESALELDNVLDGWLTGAYEEDTAQADIESELRGRFEYDDTVDC